MVDPVPVFVISSNWG